MDMRKLIWKNLMSLYSLLISPERFHYIYWIGFEVVSKNVNRKIAICRIICIQTFSECKKLMSKLKIPGKIVFEKSIIVQEDKRIF